ncbi:hypothetical protein KQX54_016675 [Cotesia glomerata]|uniref:Uncharacterized protein n=1 Tax=Cotesia glomerata TaxID=32391 RepID=A0AAV7I2X1_COTGL|nr:hypothetical protein KQX54_016675 [Cotesia glomerata]
MEVVYLRARYLLAPSLFIPLVLAYAEKHEVDFNAVPAVYRRQVDPTDAHQNHLSSQQAKGHVHLLVCEVDAVIFIAVRLLSVFNSRDSGAWQIDIGNLPKISGKPRLLLISDEISRHKFSREGLSMTFNDIPSGIGIRVLLVDH